MVLTLAFNVPASGLARPAHDPQSTGLALPNPPCRQQGGGSIEWPNPKVVSLGEEIKLSRLCSIYRSLLDYIVKTRSVVSHYY